MRLHVPRGSVPVGGRLTRDRHKLRSPLAARAEWLRTSIFADDFAEAYFACALPIPCQWVWSLCAEADKVLELVKSCNDYA